MSQEVKWLLIGAGAIASKRVAAALAGADNSSLTAVCDVNEPAAKALADEYNLTEVYTDASEAITKTSANAVYVATPVSLHVPLGIEALRAGKHLLVEKPLGLNAADAEKLLDESKKHPDLKTGCAFYRRYYPAYDLAKQMLDAGEFGELTLVRIGYFGWYGPDEPTWRVKPELSGGGPLSDMGSHMFDVMIGLLDLPETVSANTHTLVQNYNVEDSATMFMQLPGGADVVASFHWNTKTWSHDFEIVGTEGKLKWFPYDSGNVVKTIGRNIEELSLAPAENMHQPMVQGFVDAINGGAEFRCPLSDAIRTNQLLDAIYKSSQDKSRISL